MGSRGILVQGRQTFARHIFLGDIEDMGGMGHMGDMGDMGHMAHCVNVS
jgi:hypothetical protein